MSFYFFLQNYFPFQMLVYETVLQVCVNPYHYERVVPPGIGTIDLSNLKIEHRSSSQDDSNTLSPGSTGTNDDLSK